MKRLQSTLMLGVLATAGWCWSSYSGAQISQVPYQQSESAVVDENTQSVMAAKLAHSQLILEGLVTQDFESVEKAAAALSEISLDPAPEFSKAGDKSDEQVYEHFRMEFARQVVQLQRHARRKELEATAYVQQNMTATCIACHDYIRDDLK